MWLAGFYALDKLNRQSRMIENAGKRLKELEVAQSSGTALDATVTSLNDDQADAQGCLGAVVLLLAGIPLCCVFLWFLLCTTVGQILLVLFGLLLLLVLFGKKKG
jgi:hypothetical protein